MTEPVVPSGVLERLKDAPLPTVVLLPGTGLSLHIFEPRYRALVADALAGDRLLAMAMAEPGGARDSHGRPRVRAMVGVGKIVAEERLSDGRYNLRLEGLGRAEILEEWPPELAYRVVRARWATEVPARDARLAETLRSALASLCGVLPSDSAEALARAVADVNGPGPLADRVASLHSDSAFRQKVLEALEIDARLALALEVVGESLLRAGGAPPPGGHLN